MDRYLLIKELAVTGLERHHTEPLLPVFDYWERSPVEVNPAARRRDRSVRSCERARGCGHDGFSPIKVFA
jgi:hypothetical protein